MAIDHGYLQLDGTEDDDDDDDDDMTQQTAHSGCERCEDRNICCNLSSREKE